MTFKDSNYIFQEPKLSTKSHILNADIQNLEYIMHSEKFD